MVAAAMQKKRVVDIESLGLISILILSGRDDVLVTISAVLATALPQFSKGSSFFLLPVWRKARGLPLPVCQLARLRGPQKCHSYAGLP